MQHIIMFSGGIQGYEVTRRVVEQVNDLSSITLLFADTLIESPGLYAFRDAVAKRFNVWLEIVCDGRTPFEVFRDVKFLGNTRADPCSRILKREILRKWLNDNCDPAETVIYYGFDWTEQPRIDKQVANMEGWQTAYPLATPPMEFKAQWIERAEADGLPVSDSYRLGLAHDNCGGGCIKQGQAGFARLLDRRPETYALWEREERDISDFLGKPVSILRNRKGGDTKPLTLRQFRERLQADAGAFDKTDWGACSCFG